MELAVKTSLLTGKKVGVALSGGADSVVLLHYLFTQKEKLNISLVAINVEHGIRGEESKKDSEFCKEFCHSLGVQILSYTVDALAYKKETGLSEEESARVLRYRCFDDAISNGACEIIVTAHHVEDNSESVLINLLRGSGVKGLGGIPEVKGKFVRPMLDVKKEEILAYAKENDLSYVTDSTNFNPDYTRNYLRLNVLPLIKDKFPTFDEGVKRLSEIVKKEDAFLDEQAEKFIKPVRNGFAISVLSPEVLFLRATIIILKRLGVKKDYEKKHADAVYSLTKEKNGTKINLPQNVIAVKEYDDVVLFTEKATEFIKTEFKEGVYETDNGTLEVVFVKRCYLPDELTTFSGVNYADLDKINSAVIRTKEEGDVFTKFGGGSKKLKDFFIDKKVPVRERKDVLLVASGKTVLYVGGIEISDLIKVDNSTVNVVQFIYKRKA